MYLSPRLALVSNIVNMTIGVGFYVLPFSIFETGIILGSVIMILVSFLSYSTCCFIIESISRANLIDYCLEYNSDISDLICDSNLNLSTNNNIDIKLNACKELNNKSTLDNTINKDLINNKKLTNYFEIDMSIHDAKKSTNIVNSYFMNKRIEISELSYKAFKGGTLFYVSSFILTMYLYIGQTAAALLFSNILLGSLETIFPNLQKDMLYYTLLFVYYFFVILLSLKTIDELGKFSSFILMCRIVIFFILLFSMFWIITNYGISPINKVPLIRPENSTLMLGNCLFLYMLQHSVPGMVYGFKNNKLLFSSFLIGVFISVSVLILYSFITTISFGHHNSCDANVFPSAIRNYFNLNFTQVKLVSFFVNFNAFLNIITGAIGCITLTNNLKFVYSKVFKIKEKSLNNEQNTIIQIALLIRKIAITFIILIPSITTSLIISDIQFLLKYFNSIFGFYLMLVVPILLVIRFRYITNKNFNYFEDRVLKFCKSKIVIFVYIVIVIVLFGVIISNMFKGSSKSCVGEDDLSNLDNLEITGNNIGKIEDY